MEKITYTVNNKEKCGNDLTLDDCRILFQEFINKNGYYPKDNECLVKNNLPHNKILSRVLKENKILLSDWQTQFGKVGHVRCYPQYYDIYVEKYKNESNKKGRALLLQELTNNVLGLPSAGFLVDYCPDPNVKTYDDFVKWCGYNSNSLRRDKDDIIQELKEFELHNGRAVTTADLRRGLLSFSDIVVKRIWGSISNCRKEIGLSFPISQPKRSFEEYKRILDNCLDDIYKFTGRRIITWRDIEDDSRKEYRLEHKTIVKAFKREKLNFYEYLVFKGYTFQPNSWGITVYSDEGELSRSVFEIDFSNFLQNELSLKYNVDYKRDVQYKYFCDCNSKINCDYQIIINGKSYFIEIAGVLYSEKDLDNELKTKRKEDYRQKMIKKIDIFNENHINYLILYIQDMRNNKYKEKTCNFLGL